eukprot:CAMPEP_0194132994 /NCGR_PEP_ID=MMETSP0152-20130528/3327_1 /TAXON_ID=1049557 /ORGANISM="Thalassiothrix antarctica, Strain L6-D1" /LENGTH=135 /DNA_ID=CAMNT_0038828213 /DNA_START=43 /DNA_END=450 /DNA_ORIENTATION=+
MDITDNDDPKHCHKRKSCELAETEPTTANTRLTRNTRPTANTRPTTTTKPAQSVFYVLVKTEDKEYREDWETRCDSEVVGIYATRALAKKAKRKETKHMDSNDGITYDYGETFYTSYVIHKKSIQTKVESDSDSD